MSDSPANWFKLSPLATAILSYYKGEQILTQLLKYLRNNYVVVKIKVSSLSSRGIKHGEQYQCFQLCLQRYMVSKLLTVGEKNFSSIWENRNQQCFKQKVLEIIIFLISFSISVLTLSLVVSSVVIRNL